MEDKIMTSNLEKYKQDIQKLINEGERLLSILKNNDDLKKFRKNYEVWYSESLALIKVVLPDRFNDFKKYYDHKGQKSLKEYITYTPSGLNSSISLEAREVDYAKVLFENQLGIVKAAQKRFESSLFDIKQLLQADLFDSELDAAKELNNKGFSRAAGAVAGVVLEKHLSQVCENRKIKITKKNPSINDFNQRLKDEGVIEIEVWRCIQHLAEIRNLCVHNKEKDPQKVQIEELINGVGKIIKTIF
jgi:hypothetical protein